MESGSATFEENFRNCCSYSRYRLAYEKAHEDKEHILVSQECDNLFQEIRAKLGEDDILLNKYEEAKNHGFCLDEEFIYQQGFQDCVVLLRWIGLL